MEENLTTHEVSGDVLDACAREPIQTPGAIQPAGVLLGVSLQDKTVRYASANAAAWLDCPDADVQPGVGLECLFGEATTQVVEAIATAHRTAAPTTLLLTRGDRALEVVLGVAGDVAHVEVLEGEGSARAGEVAIYMQRAVTHILSTNDLETAFQTAVDEVRRISGFDRVKLYSFDEDWNGEVVAESRAEHMESYLGLHFPASDIPAQARALYVRTPSRLIADVAYVPVPLLPPPLPGAAPVDLGQSTLRSVSPVHLEYLRNMGVGASMSVSILRGGVLWGLIACHHATPHRCTYHAQSACVLIGQVLSVVIDRHESARSAVAFQARQATLAQLLDSLLRAHDVLDGLARQPRALLQLVDAEGVAVVSEESVALLGETPSEADVRRLARWVQEAASDGVYATNALGRDMPDADGLVETASGVLAMLLARSRQHVVLWFRPELPRTVRWAGAPSKDVRRATDGGLRLHPRQSFEAWTALRRGHSRPWTPDERVAVALFRTTILDLVYERVEEIQQLNRSLHQALKTVKARNRELQDFAYVASHDLREPLRKVRAFSDLLQRDFKGQLPEEATSYLERIENAGLRMTHLVDDLLAFARIVSQGRPFGPMDLGHVMQTVLSDLDLVIEETHATVTVPEAWPPFTGDARQIAQLLRLLLENALKFRRPGVAPVVAVTVEPAEVAGQAFRLQIVDNGIGFEPRHAERIFMPFERLHSRAEYTGTGMGLAIARRIVERHGGRITATSEPGKGTVVEVVLPESSPPPEGTAEDA